MEDLNELRELGKNTREHWSTVVTHYVPTPSFPPGPLSSAQSHFISIFYTLSISHKHKLLTFMPCSLPAMPFFFERHLYSSLWCRLWVQILYHLLAV